MKTLPPQVAAYRRTPEFSEATVPAALLRRHSTKPGVWGVIHVLEGRLRYRILEPESEECILSRDVAGIIEPEIAHEVEPLGAVRFYVEFHRESPR